MFNVNACSPRSFAGIVITPIAKVYQKIGHLVVLVEIEYEQEYIEVEKGRFIPSFRHELFLTHYRKTIKDNPVNLFSTYVVHK